MRESRALAIVLRRYVGDHRLYLLKLDQATGAVTLDDAFRDADGKAGFNFGDREWPQGWKGTGAPHGAVFSR